MVTIDTARPRFSGSTERLADAQLQPHLLLKHTQMLRRLHELQPNLAFKQAQLREAIAVLTKRHRNWRLDEKQSAEMQDLHI